MDKIKYNNEDIIDHHGVAAIIKDKENRILMQNHVKYGFWTIPVGKVKINQSISEGLKEELFEECNIKIQKFREIANKKLFYNRNGKEVIVNSHLFIIDEFSGVIKNNEPEKHLELRFMDLEEVSNLKSVSDMTLLYLELMGKKINHSYMAELL